jgi:16S rRNA (uracil1498-N3)-methyltransferase
MTSNPPRFLINPREIQNDRIRLSPSEARHARVRRLHKGEAVSLFDGTGNGYAGIVHAISSRGAEVQITERLPYRSGESNLDLTLALAVLKGERFDWVVEKVTELGVSRVRPFVCERSLARPSANRRTRWQQIALSAAKQCGRTVVPQVDTPLPFANVIAESSGHRILFWQGERGYPTTALSEIDLPPVQVTIIIGPEGGFTDEEVRAAKEAGCQLAHIGPRILRAETAAVMAVGLSQHLWGDLGR